MDISFYPLIIEIPKMSLRKKFQKSYRSSTKTFLIGKFLLLKR